LSRRMAGATSVTSPGGPGGPICLFVVGGGGGGGGGLTMALYIILSLRFMLYKIK